MPLCEIVRATPNPGLFAGQNHEQRTDGDYLLYLFACGLRWQQCADPSAGWDLIQALRSCDQTIENLSANLLLGAKTQASLTRQRPFYLRETTAENTLCVLPESKKGNEMNTPYGLEICESCVSCKLNKNDWFCHLSQAGSKSLNMYSHLTVYPSGALLFVEGQSPRGIFILCSGRVKLSATSRDGKVLILKMAEPGAVLGLSAVVAGEPYELTAETSMPSQVNFVYRESLIQLMRANPEVGLHATEVLSREFQAAYRDIHDLILARSSVGKLARLLLSWVTEREQANDSELRVRAAATHEEMAQMIGASRETVTRLLGDLKKRELIRLEGSMLVIRNRSALEEMAA